MERSHQNRVEVDGSWVTVDVYGSADGPAIVIVPGVMADAAAWAAVAQQLRGWATVAVLNRRGRHPSGPLTSTYDLNTEVRDAHAVLRSFSDVRTVFGWSYGGLITLHLANVVAVPHLIAYEPIMAPFGMGALTDLQAAHTARDLDEVTRVALTQVTGLPIHVVDSLHSDTALWAELCRLSAPLYEETRSINGAIAPRELGGNADRIDLIVGELNRGQVPYGTTFEDVRHRASRGQVHELAEQAHLAHLEAPEQLASLLNDLRLRAD